MSPVATLAHTPEPPYYAVIFTSLRREGDKGYAAMADRRVDLGSQREGFLGIDSTRDPQGLGITVSHWRDEASIRAWKRNAEHAQAQQAGRELWYGAHTVRMAKVERAYTRP